MYTGYLYTIWFHYNKYIYVYPEFRIQRNFRILLADVDLPGGISCTQTQVQVQSVQSERGPTSNSLEPKGGRAAARRAMLLEGGLLRSGRAVAW